MGEATFKQAWGLLKAGSQYTPDFIIERQMLNTWLK